ncbi:MAG: alpha/beta hydrolase [Deltaproteobacteria bacterium CG_4_10_14_3_um_filter_60_8]|nr:MAG: alpha/beta hydrolase [Desulfobacterales bacterium CG2_30_60_27]PIP43174.1 MAG: alpha/beta hydrolase [Deltaproteobacteria bacterium CG23_combo_of_CG06-09_8_20_14_all_60_8]PIY21172.1 MAG: alpha/beta hydrolase [Deltaproteobacteria bacterium CG_4_10_14_3_um_filter_60_8]
MTARLCCLLVALLLVGCAVTPSPELRRETARRMATAAGWESLRLPAGAFTLAGFVPRQVQAGDTLTVYIEGDGLAWTSSARVSPDPTPVRPLALELALRHPHGAAAYLARPCQYVEGVEARNCDETWWTDRRFAAEVVAAADQAVTQLKQRFQAREIVLVGYSGGGAVAALVAARRSDVGRLVTVAGNLEHRAWAELHHLAPLTGSLNPADAWPALAGLPQLHFVGGQDRNVSREVAASYQARFPANQRPQLRVIDEFDHACCWAEQWPELFR